MMQKRLETNSWTLASRLRAMRKERDLTLTQLADKAGVRYQTIQAIERGQTKNPGCIIQLADALGVEPRWLKDGMGDKTLPPSPLPTKSEDEMHNDFVMVPRFDVSASAGFGESVECEQIVDHLAFKYDWVQGDMGLDPRRLALITAIGDSMSPTINSGDLLLVDMRQAPLRDGSLIVVRLGMDLYVKRAQMLLSGGVRLLSDNQAYNHQDIDDQGLRDLSVLGRVVWIGRRVG